METISVIDKVEGLLNNSSKGYIEVDQEILEKYSATDVTSEFATRLSAISDPFDRLVVGFHFVDQLDIEQVDEMRVIREAHEPLFRLMMKLNRSSGGSVNEDIKSLVGKYLANFK